LQSIDELAEIRAEVTPMMQGSPSKQRLHLVKAYIEALIKFSTESDKNAETLKKVTDLIRAMIVELITAINNSNFKIRKLSEEIFLRISYLLSLFDASAQLLQILLVGFASNSPQTKSCTVRALIYNLKANVSWRCEIKHSKNEIDNLSDSEDEGGDDKNKFTKLLASTPEI
jgi:hypothetical protein